MDERKDWHLTDALHSEQGRGDPFAAAVRATRMPMLVTDPKQPDNPIVFANEAFQQLTGYSREELLGRNCRMLQGPETDPDAVTKLRDAVALGKDVSVDILNYRKDGSTFWNALFVSPVRADNGEIQFFFASQVDLTSRIAAQDQLLQQKATVERQVAERTAALEASLAAQTLLLHEVDHRVKNNLTMIGAILRLEAREAKSEAASRQLRETMKRIDALGTVHRKLYQSADVTRFDVGRFSAILAAELIPGVDERIRVVTDLRAAPIAVEGAAPLGLVINELFSDIFGDAEVRDDEAVIRISATTIDGRATLTLEDEGVRGRNAPADLSGISRTLVKHLSQQTKTTVTREKLERGMRVKLVIGSDT